MFHTILCLQAQSLRDLRALHDHVTNQKELRVQGLDFASLEAKREAKVAEEQKARDEIMQKKNRETRDKLVGR